MSFLPQFYSCQAYFYGTKRKGKQINPTLLFSLRNGIYRIFPQIRRKAARHERKQNEENEYKKENARTREQLLL
jgi:hypothetical protein